MHPAYEHHIPDGLLAANALLAENSHQGLPAPTNTLHQGFYFAISSTVRGLQFCCYETASGTVDAPNNTRNCKTGFGIGVTAGADATAGLGYGAGANGSVGAGVFAGNGLNAGAFASGGAGASAFGHGASAPSANLIGRFFAGLVGGAGAGVFVTNASQASQLRGNGGSWTIDFGDVINGAGQFSAGTDAAGNSIWSFSFTLGVGLGAGYQQVTNRTATVGRGGC